MQVEWRWDTEILFSSPVCVEELQKAKGTASCWIGKGLAMPLEATRGGYSPLLTPLLPWGRGPWVVPPWHQAEAHNLVSGPAACRVGKESRIFATSMAHRCPKTLLYQSGERPLQG